MNRLGLAAAVLLAAAGGLVSYGRVRLEDRPRSASGSPAPADLDAVARTLGRTFAPRQLQPGPAGASSPRTSAEAGDARLAAQLELAPAAPSAASDALARHRPDELALFADVERRTGRPAPPEVLEVVLLRRSGADQAELDRVAKRRLAGDALARAAVLGWLARSRTAEHTAGVPLP